MVYHDNAGPEISVFRFGGRPPAVNTDRDWIDKESVELVALIAAMPEPQLTIVFGDKRSTHVIGFPESAVPSH